MFSLCFAQTTRSTESTHVSSNVKRPGEASCTIELYIPAPEDTSRETSFQWHIATRNFFAFVSGKPLVGNHLGQAMINLQERMRLFRSGRVDNNQDFLEYAEAQGYLDFVGFPDYALAMLYYAEHYKLRDAWIDAFAHCVGMNEKLVLSPEFPVSTSTVRGQKLSSFDFGTVCRSIRQSLKFQFQHCILPTTASSIASNANISSINPA